MANLLIQFTLWTDAPPVILNRDESHYVFDINDYPEYLLTIDTLTLVKRVALHGEEDK